MRKAIGFYVLDWAVSRRRVWSMPHPTPAHLLRSVFERAANFAEARELLTREPISTPAIFSLAGLKPTETVVIERTETDARVHVGPNVAANHWEAPGWRGRSRGQQSAERASMMHRIIPELVPDFFLAGPADPQSQHAPRDGRRCGRGLLIAQGFEAMRPATEPLVLAA